jgi:pimeloyl-ACP methyl ester carboxylesterase
VKPKLKRRLGVLLALFLVAFITLNLVAYRQAYSMMHFTAGSVRTEKPENLSLGGKIKVLFCGVDVPRPHSTLAPDTLGPACGALVIPETNGIKLGAWYCPGPPTNPLIILFHGYAGDKAGMIPEARAFLEMDCSVMLVDFRGSGDSSESSTTVGYYEAEDVAAAADFARSLSPHSKTILYGGSMGAAAVLRAVAHCGVQPDAIIVEAVFDEMFNTVRHRFESMGVPSFPAAQLLVFWGGVQAGFNGFAHNPVQYAASVRCPILFLHGTADPRARLEDAHRVFAAVPAPKSFTVFPNLGHEAAITAFPVEWKQTVSQFLKDPANKIPQ